MSSSASGNRGSADPATGSTDIYSVGKCVELYDAAVEPAEPSIAALLDAFLPAFLDIRNLPSVEREGHDSDKERSQFLDIGCGPGSFTLRYLVPRLPSWCKRLVAVDMAKSMLTFARENRSHPRIEYHYMNIMADEDVAKFVREQGHFQRVYSFLMLQWIGDQRHAMRNIEALLAPGGECFLVFTTNLIVQDVFEAMLESPRWQKYTDVLKQMVPETRVLKDIGSLRSHLADLVRATNLTPLACEVMHTVAKIGLDKERAIDFYTFLNPVYELVNDAEKAELRQFTQDVIGDFKKRKSGDTIDERDFLIIHAYKPLK